MNDSIGEFFTTEGVVNEAQPQSNMVHKFAKMKFFFIVLYVIKFFFFVLKSALLSVQLPKRTIIYAVRGLHKFAGHAQLLGAILDGLRFKING